MLAHGLKLSVLGLVAGVSVALMIERLLGSLLYGVTPTDPTTYGAVVLILLVASLSATWVPAQRAAQTDAAIAMRAE